MLAREHQRLREQGQRVVAAAVPPAEEVGRGRAFMTVYAVVLCLGALAFIGLAIFVRVEGVTRLDIRLLRAVQSIQQPIAAWVLNHTSDIGYPPYSFIAFVAVFVGLFAVGLRLEAGLAVASSLLAGVAGGAVRLLIARGRPSVSLAHVAAPQSGYSFPSGHVIMYTTLFGFAFYAVAVTWRNSLARDAVLVLLALPVLLVGLSRVYLGAHWPSDVIGAYLLAGLWLAGTIEVHLRLTRRLGNDWGWSWPPWQGQQPGAT